MFALGILAYEMLAGRSPFAVPAFVLAMAEQPIPKPAPIERSPLAAIIAACMTSDPAERPRARAIADALRG